MCLNREFSAIFQINFVIFKLPPHVIPVKNSEFVNLKKLPLELNTFGRINARDTHVEIQIDMCTARYLDTSK
jgi:hypothetical protein